MEQYKKVPASVKTMVYSVLLAAFGSLITSFIIESTSDARKAAPLDYVNQQLDKKADKEQMVRELEKKVDKDVMALVLQNLQEIKQEQQKINEYLRNNK